MTSASRKRRSSLQLDHVYLVRVDICGVAQGLWLAQFSRWGRPFTFQLPPTSCVSHREQGAGGVYGAIDFIATTTANYSEEIGTFASSKAHGVSLFWQSGGTVLQFPSRGTTAKVNRLGREFPH